MKQAIYYALCVLIWGSTWYVVKFQLGEVPLAWSVTYRFGLAALFLYVFAVFTKLDLKFTRRQHWGLLGIGIFMFSCNYLLVYASTQYLTSGLVALAFSCMTFWNILNARLLLKTPLEPAVGGAALLGLVGLALIFSGEIGSLNLADGVLIGLGFGLASGLVASLGNTIAASGIFEEASPLSVNTWGMAYGTLINAVIAFALAGAPVFTGDTVYLTSLIYLSVVGTIVSFTIYLWLIRHMGLARPAYIAVLTPVVALSISSFLESFQWTPTAIAGFFLVMLGNVLMVRSRQKAPAPRPVAASRAMDATEKEL